jgi:hypothetical protein
MLPNMGTCQKTLLEIHFVHLGNKEVQVEMQKML